MSQTTTFRCDGKLDDGTQCPAVIESFGDPESREVGYLKYRLDVEKWVTVEGVYPAYHYCRDHHVFNIGYTAEEAR